MPAFDIRPASNGVLYLHWTEDRRSKRVSTRTRDMAEAKAFLAEWLVLDARTPTKDLTCGEIWQHYWVCHASRNDIPANVKLAQQLWKNLSVFFAAQDVGFVCDKSVENYTTARVSGRVGRPASVGTVRSELILFRAALNRALKDKLIDVAPEFKMPPAPEPRPRWLKPAELDAVLSCLVHERRGDTLSRLEIFVWLAVETLARSSAILELTWDRVDFETGVIDFNKPGRRRTRKRRTVSPISSRLRPVLERAYAERTSETVCIHGGEVRWMLNRLSIRCGVPGLHAHLFRHTSATLLMRSGASLWDVAGLLGDTLKTTEKTYAKHDPQRLRETIDLAFRT